MSDILCVTNRRLCREDFLTRIREIAAGRPAAVLLREKDLPESEYKELAAKVLAICGTFHTPCILHTFHRAAAELGAKAIHLPLGVLREMSEEQKKSFPVIGASCHSVEDALEAERLGCSYITAGHLFETKCKKGLPGRGLDFLRQVVAAVHIPVCGIGGIDAETINTVRDAKAAGVCIMSSIMECPDVSACLSSLADPRQAVSKPYAVFDLDGTLIDSMRFWKNLGAEYLQSKGFSGDFTDILNEIAPMTVSESAAFFVKQFAMNDTAQAVAAELQQRMADHYRKDIPLKAHVLPFLRRLQSEGVRMCVASATDEALMAACLKRLGIFPMFDFLLSCETLATHKREPLIYQIAADRFHADRSEITVYEDAFHAAETAKNAGFHVVAVYEKEEEHWQELCRLADQTVNLY